MLLLQHRHVDQAGDHWSVSVADEHQGQLPVYVHTTCAMNTSVNLSKPSLIVEGWPSNAFLISCDVDELLMFTAVDMWSSLSRQGIYECL